MSDAREGPAPVEQPISRAMPVPDKIIWFAVGPIVGIGGGFVINPDVAYEQPLIYLLDVWLVIALGTWILRRPYSGWAKAFRWIVPVLWLGMLVGRTEGLGS